VKLIQTQDIFLYIESWLLKGQLALGGNATCYPPVASDESWGECDAVAVMMRLLNL
jgi:hypothetical protein